MLRPAHITNFVRLAATRYGHDEATLFEDPLSGLRHLHLATADVNAVVALALPTPTTGLPGLPHVIEHLAGSGSRNFPGPRLFPSLMSRLKTTFLNAYTGPDHTAFVAASTSPSSFDVLAEALMDGVFAPTMAAPDFDSEAVRVDRSGRPGGVVWQEAVDGLSNPAGIAARAVTAAVYGPSSWRLLQGQGEDPRELLTLTVEDARRYHAEYYHPLCAWLVTVGDVPPDRVHRIARRVLGHRSPHAPDLSSTHHPTIELAPAGAPLTVVPGGPGGRDGDVIVAVPIAAAAHPLAAVHAEVLADVLTGAGGPVWSALRARGLRAGVGTGAYTHLPHTVLSISAALDGTAGTGEVEELVLDAMRRPLPLDLVRAAARRRLLRARDRGNRSLPPRPWGVRTVMDLVNGLVHGADPFEQLARVQHLRAVADAPDSAAETLSAALAAHGTRLAKIDRSGPTARQRFDRDLPALLGARTHPPAPDPATGSMEAAPVGQPAGRHAWGAGTAAAGGRPELRADLHVAARRPEPPIRRIRDGLDAWVSELLGHGVMYAHLELATGYLSPELLCLAGAHAQSLGLGAWPPMSAEMVSDSDHVDLEQVRTRLQITAYCLDEDAEELLGHVARIWQAPARAREAWPERLKQALRTRLANPPGAAVRLLRSAVAAELTGTGAVRDATSGWGARRTAAELLADPARLTVAIDGLADVLASLRGALVITAGKEAGVPDLAPLSGLLAADQGEQPEAGAPAVPAARSGIAAGGPEGAVMPRLIVLEAEEGTSAVVAGYRGVAVADPAAPAFAVVAQVLQERLYGRLRVAGSAHGAKVTWQPRDGVLSVIAMGASQIPSVLDLITESIEELAVRGPDEAELRAARSAAVATLDPLHSVHTLAADVLRERRQGRTGHGWTTRTALEQVSAHDVTELARTHLSEERQVAGVTGAARYLDEAQTGTRTPLVHLGRADDR
ncbi:insulinase family protein [Nonomuraea sp. NPDC049141]|uniref:insulinase family protein n=1 Tax=Nonomuraea sp. NPDC049141 TaxID=3155500 RepID=UPI0033F73D03